jgi:peptide/nickel transport system substrate-binding protein
MQRRTLLKSAAAAGLLPAVARLAAPAIAQPARASTLRFVPQANLTVLDPVFTTAIVTANHAYYVFDTLFSNDGAGVPKPQMAAGHSVSADGKTWRITLRDGLKFHDNTPVRAIDCITSVQRWAKRDPFGQLLAAVVEKWNAPDDRTMEIVLNRPFPLLPNALGKPDNPPFMMPERLARTDANSQVTEMVGSGPYRWIAKEYNSGSKMVYEKFDGYVPRSEAPDWGTGAKIAHYQRVEWNVIPDPSTAAAALQSGEIDWWEQPLVDLLPVLAHAPGVKLKITNPLGNESLMRLNCLQPPFNDVAIRRAVLMGVNQQDYMRATFGDDTSLWHTCRSEFPCGTPYETDDNGKYMPGSIPAAAKALKATAYAGEKVVLLSPTDFAAIRPLCLVAADMMKKIGFNVDLVETDWGTVVQRRASMEPVSKGGWSAFCTYGTSGGYATPATSALVRGQGRAGWFGWWSSPEAEKLTQEWLTAPDPASQKRFAQELSTLVMRDVGTVPLGINYTKTAYRGITGVLNGVAPYPWNVRPA